ncbi:Intracellular serine protease [Phycisphaerae bacterium RAS2]|nr:Intracellular serine protease [Phycisphaerae bacterium RAS2]
MLKIICCITVLISFLGTAARAELETKGFVPIADRPGEFGVVMEVVGGRTTYQLGESLQLRFKCAQPGHLTLVSIDSAGDAVLMFPNKWSPDSKVVAGKWLDIPSADSGFKLVARPPLGATYVRAFVTPRPIVCIESLRKADPGASMSALGQRGGEQMNRLLREIKGFEPQPDTQPVNERAMAVITLRLTIADGKPRRADGKLLGEIPEGADLDGLTPAAHPKAKLLAALRDGNVGYRKHHEKGLVIPPTFSFDSQTGTVRFGERVISTRQREEKVDVEFLVETADPNANEIDRLRSMRVKRVAVRGPGGLAEAQAKLRSEGARNVQPVVYYHVFGPATKDEPMLKLQWAMRNEFARAAETGAIEAISKAVRRPIVVAVVDSGMAANHPDLAGALHRNSDEIPGNDLDDDDNGFVDDVSGYDFVEMKGSHLIGAADDHGTFVASVIASRADGKGILGVCPWAEILPIRAAGLDGSFSTLAAVQSLLYAAACGAKIVNCSWGGYGSDPAIYRAMAVLREKGVLIICAAGNEANDNDVYPATPASYDLDNIISVAALRVDGDLASFSNWGARSVHIAAPGELILGYPDGSGNVAAWDGTSFSAPMVAGAAALVWAKHPDWDYGQVKNAILSSARRTEALQGRIQTGGMLDLAAAVSK